VPPLCVTDGEVQPVGFGTMWVWV